MRKFLFVSTVSGENVVKVQECGRKYLLVHVPDHVISTWSYINQFYIDSGKRNKEELKNDIKMSFILDDNILIVYHKIISEYGYEIRTSMEIIVKPEDLENEHA